MPPPVAFNLSLAPLPVNYNPTPQQWATDVINRLTITPSQPWSAFQVGSVLPTSDEGPVLLNSVQWYVWNSGSASYEALQVDGGGLLANTVQIGSLITESPGTLISWDGSGNPTVIAPPTAANQLLTSGTSSPFLPSWQSAPGATFFEVTCSTDQFVTTNNVAVQVNFNLVRQSNNITFDTVNQRAPIPAGQTWFFYFALQLNNPLNTTTVVQVTGSFRLNTANIAGVCNDANFNSSGPLNRSGLSTSWVMVPQPGLSYVDIAINALEATPSSTDFKIEANVFDTRFGGFRLA